MNLTPAQDQIEAQRKREAIELCGKNRGTHNYIPIAWNQNENVKTVTRLLCLTCLHNVAVKTIIENYPEVKL